MKNIILIFLQTHDVSHMLVLWKEIHQRTKTAATTKADMWNSESGSTATDFGECPDIWNDTRALKYPAYNILNPTKCSGSPYSGTRAADSALARIVDCFNLNHYLPILSLPNKYYENPPTRRKYSFQHLSTPWNMRPPAAHILASTERALPDCPEPAPSAE